MSKPSVGIVGAGISGLHTADELLRRGYHVTLYEARARAGGRAFSQGNDDKASESSQDVARFDLGPSWFWRGQTHIETLVESLGLNTKVFEQYLQGDGLYESAPGSIQRGHLGFSMAGSLRIEGGLYELIHALLSRIEAHTGYGESPTIKLNSKVEALTLRHNDQGAPRIEVLANNEAQAFDHVVLALPPRIALQHIRFSPTLGSERVTQLNQVSTWMAGQAKAVIEYSQPFWRELGLSGDAISQVGPLAEIHDASSDQFNTYALFGFLSVPPSQRPSFETQKDELIEQQLTRLFGEKAAKPKRIFYKNWAQDEFTATPLDQTIPRHHPHNEWHSYVEQDWGDHLIWSGSESAPSHYNGYIEGALQASELAIERLQNCLAAKASTG